MNTFDYDLLVLGGGSGGVRSARMAAQSGARVALCEGDALGGTCVVRGCIPKKLMVYASRFREDFLSSQEYGWQWEGVPPTLDLAAMKAAVQKEVRRLSGVYENLLTNAGVTLLRGFGRILDPHTVKVGEQSLTAKTILICTGGRPHRPSIPGSELAITSDEAFLLPLSRPPEKLLIVGAGYIALEFAGIFQGLGSQVDVLVRGEAILNDHFDRDMRIFLQKEMEKKGIVFHFGQSPSALSIAKAQKKQILTEKNRVFTGDEILLATGRRANTDPLGLGPLGVERNDKGAIVVDETFRTNIPSLYALGDCTDRLNLTPVALAEAMVFVNQCFGNRTRTMSYEAIPTAVFSQPELATVGLTEEEARRRWGEIKVYKSEFRPLFHTLSGKGERTLMKMIVETSGRKVVGMHMVGKDAAEVIQGFAVAVRAGLTKEQFDQTLGIHPSSGEEFVTLRDSC